ncbi:MAG: hypothetical protein PHI19_00240 [Clostridia bacterium]|nr:hypothetical protein [Clostridia bacterium]
MCVDYMLYVYLRTERDLWTVGFYRNDTFVSESDHSSPDAAAERVAWLNGARFRAEDYAAKDKSISADVVPLGLAEAAIALREGKKIRMVNWKKTDYIRYDRSRKCFVDAGGNALPLFVVNASAVENDRAFILCDE